MNDINFTRDEREKLAWTWRSYKVPARSKTYLLRKGDITHNAQSKPEKAEKEGRDTEEANRKLLRTG